MPEYSMSTQLPITAIVYILSLAQMWTSVTVQTKVAVTISVSTLPGATTVHVMRDLECWTKTTPALVSQEL